MNAEFSKSIDVCKGVIDSEKLVFGWGAISKYWDAKSGTYQPFVDSEGDFFDEDGLEKAAKEFMKGDRNAYDSHGRKDNKEVIGKIIHAFPLTETILKAFEITSPFTGLLIGMEPTPEIMAKYISGEYKSFSVGGKITEAGEF